MINKYFFVDAETDGLYGGFLSIAVVVVDQQFRVLEEKYMGIAKEQLVVHDAWTKEHVLPILGDYFEFYNEEELLEAFWHLWLKYREDSYAIGDVIFPVEARLFQRCVNQNLEERKFLGPYPFLDLSSILMAKGINPGIERKELIENQERIKQHNALDDVYMSIEILNKVID